MKTKKLSILLSVVLATSIFAAGCGSTSKTKSDSNSAAIENMNETGLPIVKEKVTYNITARTYPVTNKDYNSLQYFKDMEEKTNVHINWTTVDVSAWNEKKGLVFAGSNLPDAFYGGWVLNDNEPWEYGSQGLLIPLEDMIDKYCPNLKKLFDENPEYKKALVAPDGHIYSLPLIDNLQLPIQDTMFINKKWLDKLGLKVPTTEEFKNVLIAFRDKDPNGNGEKDEIPFDFVFGNGVMGVHNLTGSFGLPDVFVNNHMLVRDDKIVYTAAEPEYKETIKYLNSLAKENLIDKEAFTHTTPVYQSKVKSNKVGVFIGWSLSAFFGTTDCDYVPLLPLKGPNGDQMWGYNKYATFQSKGAFAITSECKNPEILMRWIDQSYEPEMSLQCSLGLYGTNLEKQPDGKIKKLSPPEGMTSEEFREITAPAVSGVYAIPKEIADRVIPDPSYEEKVSYVKMYEKFVPDNINIMPSLFYSKEDTERINDISTDVLSYTKSQFAKWILQGGVEEEWDAYVKKLNEMGLQDLLKIYQNAYDEYMNE